MIFLSATNQIFKEVFTPNVQNISADGIIVYSPQLSSLFDRFEIKENFSGQEFQGLDLPPGASFGIRSIAGNLFFCIESHSNQTDLNKLHASVKPVQLAAKLGIERALVIGAAESLKSDGPELGVITDQINLTGRNPLIGANDDSLGVRFPDMTGVYEPGFRKALENSITEMNVSWEHGVLVGVSPERADLSPDQMKGLGGFRPYYTTQHLIAEVIALRHSSCSVGGLVILHSLENDKMIELLESLLLKIF